MVPGHARPLTTACQRVRWYGTRGEEMPTYEEGSHSNDRGGVVRSSAVGCEELGQMGRVDISGCCETCHSAERYSWGGSLGPCRARLPDGRQAFVCCASKKRLLGRRARDGVARTTIRAPREAEEEGKP